MKINFEAIEKHRLRTGFMKSDTGDDFGIFRIPTKKEPFFLTVMSAPSDAQWEHVSVSTPKRTPTWDEMCRIKDLFFSENEVVWQYHPAKEDHVNNHAHCLHLWRLKDFEMPMPPTIAVGNKALGTIFK